MAAEQRNNRPSPFAITKQKWAVMREHGINGDEAELLLYRSGTLAFEDCNRDVQQRIRATQQG